ncbi:MAG: hypothetical protein ACFFD4_07230 [Candidatus Odinarchaeota archaeon]
MGIQDAYKLIDQGKLKDLFSLIESLKGVGRNNGNLEREEENHLQALAIVEMIEFTVNSRIMRGKILDATLGRIICCEGDDSCEKVF